MNILPELTLDSSVSIVKIINTLFNNEHDIHYTQG